MTVNSPAPGTPQTYTKAVWGAVAAVLGLALPVAIIATTSGSDGGSTITTNEWLMIVLAAVGGGGASGITVATVRNRPKV